MKNIYGKNVLPTLAETYPQLYLAPGDESIEKYKSVVRRGKAPETKSLSHFITNERDSCLTESTPAGKIRIVTLNMREDFETFLNIMANRCVKKEIPVTQGASIIDGIANWKKINAYKEEYYKAELESGRLPDWPSEFKRFTTDKSNYLDAIILLGVGAYSGIPAERFGLEHEEWIEYSHKIRKSHECTHFICRRKYPLQKDAVWDEVVADAIGIMAAFGKIDIAMEGAFLGVNESGYFGGRLENYVGAGEIDETAKKVYGLLLEIEKFANEHIGIQPFDFVELLEEKQFEWWK